MTDTPSLRRSFRLVCNPGQIPSVEALLSAQGFVFEPEPFSPLARRLLQEPFPLGRSLAAFWGYVYIQDRSSMLPPLALAPGEGARVLDMCASPGSKTGLLAQLVGREGLVLGNEPARPRLANLRRNLAALNLLQAVTCSWPGESLPLPTPRGTPSSSIRPAPDGGPRTRTRRRSSAGRATASNPCWICSASS